MWWSVYKMNHRFIVKLAVTGQSHFKAIWMKTSKKYQVLGRSMQALTPSKQDEQKGVNETRKK